MNNPLTLPPADAPTSARLDAAAQELLAPPPAAPALSPPFLPGSSAPVSPATSDEAFQRALTDGTIPVFPDQPSDLAVDGNPTPLDPEAERTAWQALIAFIDQHKDEGTEVSIADPDTFMRNLA